MNQYTPGPWFVSGCRAGEMYIVVHGGVVESEPIICEPRDIANARLIAAAPDLLEALVDLLGDGGDIAEDGMCFHCGRDYIASDDAPPLVHCPAEDCAGTIARAAIAKAKGETT